MCWFAAFMANNKSSQKQKSSDYDICHKARYWNQEDYHAYMQAHGNHFSRELAKWAVSMNVNRNDSMGAKWTCEQVWSALSDMGATFSDDVKFDVVYLANTIYADHFGSSLKTIEGVLTQTMDVINDKDGYSGMVFDMWLTKMMGKCVEINFNRYM